MKAEMRTSNGSTYGGSGSICFHMWGEEGHIHVLRLISPFRETIGSQERHLSYFCVGERQVSWLNRLHSFALVWPIKDCVHCCQNKRGQMLRESGFSSCNLCPRLF